MNFVCNGTWYGKICFPPCCNKMVQLAKLLSHLFSSVKYSFLMNLLSIQRQTTKQPLLSSQNWFVAQTSQCALTVASKNGNSSQWHVTVTLRIERNNRILRPRKDLNKLTKAFFELFTLLFSRLLMLQRSILAFHLKCQLVKWPWRWSLIPSWLSVMCRNTTRSLRMKPQVMWDALGSLRSCDSCRNENVFCDLSVLVTLCELV